MRERTALAFGGPPAVVARAPSPSCPWRSPPHVHTDPSAARMAVEVSWRWDMAPPATTATAGAGPRSETTCGAGGARWAAIRAFSACWIISRGSPGPMRGANVPFPSAPSHAAPRSRILPPRRSVAEWPQPMQLAAAAYGRSATRLGRITMNSFGFGMPIVSLCGSEYPHDQTSPSTSTTEDAMRLADMWTIGRGKSCTSSGAQDGMIISSSSPLSSQALMSFPIQMRLPKACT
mmetsp:Transcript_12866/g.42460  ORF Transcript_12866/g.42460 Transcript_12866/m.42460 type:complete len:234 (-) Transcript_12866:955-1656(-)